MACLSERAFDCDLIDCGILPRFAAGRAPLVTRRPVSAFEPKSRYKRNSLK